MIDQEKSSEWLEQNKELIEKSNKITLELKEKLTPILLENFKKRKSGE